jgi:hypothetical protein
MNRYIPIAAMLVLAACTTPQQQSTIAGMESGLTAADDGFLAYLKLPVCGSPGSTVICQNLEVKAEGQKAEQIAYTTLKAAEAQAATGATVDLTAASAAVTAFTQIVNVLPHK